MSHLWRIWRNSGRFYSVNINGAEPHTKTCNGPIASWLGNGIGSSKSAFRLTCGKPRSPVKQPDPFLIGKLIDRKTNWRSEH